MIQFKTYGHSPVENWALVGEDDIATARAAVSSQLSSPSQVLPVFDAQPVVLYVPQPPEVGPLRQALSEEDDRTVGRWAINLLAAIQETVCNASVSRPKHSVPMVLMEDRFQFMKVNYAVSRAGKYRSGEAGSVRRHARRMCRQFGATAYQQAYAQAIRDAREDGRKIGVPTHAKWLVKSIARFARPCAKL